MPVIDIDPDLARSRLKAAGVTIEPGNTDYERWRARRGEAVAVAYDDSVLVQGAQPMDLVALITEVDGEVHLYFDGASRGNPGPAAIGWVLVSSDGILAEGGQTIGRATNNEAEYEALIRGLEVATEMGFEAIHVKGDSELVIKQLTGEYDVNAPHLRERRVRAHELLGQFDSYTLTAVPREVNTRADNLATDALDDDRA